MALARYTYLPWLRRGAANSIVGAGIRQEPGRGERQPRGQRRQCDRRADQKLFKLMGPGDIVGIAPDLVVRTEPRNWVTDFEPNYLPFIEFYDEDFPWRHTPAPADLSTHRLAPWLSLLVLASDEFERSSPASGHCPSIVVKAPDLASFFPADDQLWAWAHVQICGRRRRSSRPRPDVAAGTPRFGAGQRHLAADFASPAAARTRLHGLRRPDVRGRAARPGSEWRSTTIHEPGMTFPGAAARPNFQSTTNGISAPAKAATSKTWCSGSCRARSTSASASATWISRRHASGCRSWPKRSVPETLRPIMRGSSGWKARSRRPT